MRTLHAMLGLLLAPFLFGSAAPPLPALDIVINYKDGAPPPDDPYGARLRAIMERAEAYWEWVYRDDQAGFLQKLERPKRFGLSTFSLGS